MDVAAETAQLRKDCEEQKNKKLTVQAEFNQTKKSLKEKYQVETVEEIEKLIPEQEEQCEKLVAQQRSLLDEAAAILRKSEA